MRTADIIQHRTVSVAAYRRSLLLQYLTAIMLGLILDWLGTCLMRPMIHDALSLRWVLPTTLTAVACVAIWAGVISSFALITGSNDFFDVLESDRYTIDARSQRTADLLQHVEAPTDERCAICHDQEPDGPVRLSCQHLFCCGCAHMLLARSNKCPLCLRPPLPVRASVQTSEDIRSRLERHSKAYHMQLFLLGLVKLCAALLHDEDRTPGVQALISVQQLVFVLLSLALVAVVLLRKAFAWVTR